MPIVLLCALTLAGGLLINPKLDTDAAIKDAMKRIEARGNVPDAQKERMHTMLEKQYGAVKSGWVRFVGPLTILIPLFFVSGVYLGVARAMGAAGRYAAILAGYAYCQLPALLKGILLVGIALPRESIDLNDLEHIVRSNVGSFLDVETTGKGVMALANSVDLFEIWGVVVGSIMLARTTKLSKNGATITVASLWLLFVLLKFCGAALGAAFGG